MEGTQPSATAESLQIREREFVGDLLRAGLDPRDITLEVEYAYAVVAEHKASQEREAARIGWNFYLAYCAVKSPDSHEAFDRMMAPFHRGEEDAIRHVTAEEFAAKTGLPLEQVLAYQIAGGQLG
jgi:hypothetical protein